MSTDHDSWCSECQSFAAPIINTPEYGPLCIAHFERKPTAIDRLNLLRVTEAAALAAEVRRLRDALEYELVVQVFAPGAVSKGWLCNGCDRGERGTLAFLATKDAILHVAPCPLAVQP